MTDQINPTDKILSRIKKMMALANDAAASQGERDNALRMAYALLAKHNLSMVQVDSLGAGDKTQNEARDKREATFAVYPWARSVAGLVADLFFCKYYFMRMGGKKATHVFVGKESNATTSQLMAEYLVKSITREGAKACGSILTEDGRTFAVGAVHRLQERVREMKASQVQDLDTKATTGTALALVNLRQAEASANALWLVNNGVSLRYQKTDRTKKVYQTSAYMQGRAFGDRVQLSKQLT